MLRTCLGAAALLAAALPVGCGSPSPPITIVEAEGVVLLNDVPLPRAKVRFFPSIDQSSAYIAAGVTDDKGRFTLTCHGEPGACAGENLVTVAEDDIPEHLTPESARDKLQAYLKALKNRPIPPIYSNAAETPIRVTVGPGSKEHKIVLKRPPG
jgi:hypothetical protein